jgi:hypothetical protein
VDRETIEGLRRAGMWIDEPAEPSIWRPLAQFGGVLLFWLVLGALAPDLLAFLAALGRWGGQ